VNPLERLKMWITKPRSNTDQIFMFLKAITIGVVVTTSGMLIIGFLAWRAEVEDDKRTEDARVERAIEACRNYNVDQTNDRAALNDMVPRLAHLTGLPEDQILIRLGDGDPKLGQERLDEDAERVATQNPYRQCSIECVERHTNPEAEKCKPAANEEGTVELDA
jgi:hypothetical protein